MRHLIGTQFYDVDECGLVQAIPATEVPVWGTKEPSGLLNWVCVNLTTREELAVKAEDFRTAVNAGLVRWGLDTPVVAWLNEGEGE